MDRIKVEPNLEADAAPLDSPDEEKYIIKEEECDVPAQLCSIKQEGSEESADHTVVKEEVKQETDINDGKEQTVNHEDGTNCDNGNSFCPDSPAEATSGIGKINQIQMTDIFPGRQHGGEGVKHTFSGILIYRCGFCDRVFSLMRDLEVHILTHVRNKPYTCQICKKDFRKSSSRMAHMRRHTGEKAFKCEICKKDFIKSARLMAHMCRHTGQKPFKCEVCNKQFTRKDSLQAHKMIHFREKQFMCEVCEQSFLRKSHLKTHMRTHRKRRCYTCEVCNIEFPRIIGFLNHMHIHMNKAK